VTKRINSPSNLWFESREILIQPIVTFIQQWILKNQRNLEEEREKNWEKREKNIEMWVPRVSWFNIAE
jgi:hypothetical protein